MKRSLPLLPLTFFLLLNACASGTAQASSEMWALFGLTQTATLWTPMPSPTFNLNIPIMINWLNNDLSTANSLESTLDANYLVTNVSFPNVQNSQALVFRVDVRCECINGAECCIPERTFVVIVGSMKRNTDAILAQVPLGVSQMLVVCSDLKKHMDVGAMSALWQDVTDYLHGHLTGHQLGVRVTRAAIP